MQVSSYGANQVRVCRVCGGADWLDVLAFGDIPLANGFTEPGESTADAPRFPLGVMSCRDCRLMSLTHVVDPGLLYRNYLYTMPDSAVLTRHMRHVAETCRRRLRLTGDDLVVEIGSNTGTQLTLLRDARVRVLGVDPAANLAALAQANGIDTLTEFFSAHTAKLVAAVHGSARLILARHVLAHIDDLADVLSGVRELLTDDGVFVVEVPYLLDLLEKVAFDTIYHEHLSYFMVRTLKTLFAQHRLRVFDVERSGVHGGSILVFAARQESPWHERPSVTRLLHAEERAGLSADSTYQVFARKVDQLRTSLRTVVGQVVAAGKRIAGYGAPAKGSTLLNICGISATELDYCLDTTELKHGKLLPGTRIPVRPPGFAKAHPPDYFLLLAWNYADEILAREADFMRRGGHFIVPVPQCAVVPARSTADELLAGAGGTGAPG